MKILMASLVAISANIATALAVTSGKVNSISRDYKDELEEYSLANDSDAVVYDEYDSLYFLDKDKKKKGKNLATNEFNPNDYILEKRVRDYGDTTGVNFSKLWYVQIGVGASQIPPASDAYKMNLLTNANLGIGKLLNGYNSLRLSFDGGIGYFNNSNELYVRYGGRLDYLFSFSNYIYGYKPTRMVDVSSVLGIGYHHNDYPGGYAMTKSNTAEGHLGLQFKFFTGPQGYFAVEPYVGLADKNQDMSGDGYWRQYDLFYGVNLSFIYYLSNNMTPNEMALYHLKKTFDEFTHEDSIKYDLLKGYHERTPWFIQTSAGTQGTNGLENVKFMRSLGHAQSFAVGKWISSRFGIRASFESKQTTSSRHLFTVQHESFYGNFSWASNYIRDNHTMFQGFAIEPMINLFGFKEDYDWNAPFGATLMFGVGAGSMTTYYMDDESVTSVATQDADPATIKQGINRYKFKTTIEQSKVTNSAEQYTAGLHLWTRITQDLQLYLEPRWTFYMYKSRNSTVDYAQDNDFSLSLGLTMLLRGNKYREHYDYEFDYDNKLYVGLGGGLNFEYTKGDYEWTNNIYNYNGVAFVGYRFNRYHGLRFSVEGASITQNSFENSIVYNLSGQKVTGYLRNSDNTLTDLGLVYADIDMYKQSAYEQWTRNYFVLMPSLSYTLSLTNLLSGYKPHRKTNLDLVLGPSFAMLVGEQHLHYGYLEPYVYASAVNSGHVVGKLPSNLTSFQTYQALAPSAHCDFTKFGFGGHVGMNLSVKFNDHIGMFASPMFYVFGKNFTFDTDEFAHNLRVIMTGNIGLTYTF
ncbi:MAG: hypothetical protein K6E54_05215 [Bacteroidaceae bacterium]|nr:hypothetical protein [Bacteroidaceae bacterium]